MTQKNRGIMTRQNAVALFTGALLLSASLAASVSFNEAARDAAPMDEVVAATTSKAGVVSWDLPVTRNDEVDEWIDFLKGRNSEKTELWLERSGKYTPMILAELRKRGMPEDLIYLAFIESGFAPNAKSRAAAVGLWQFIAETGRRYGLEVSSYVDERRDPVKATHAALDYLTELHDRFGSWYLAAAAYNTGENRVGRIMRQVTGSERGTDADFWKIAARLPRETRNYVPLMLAAGHIGKEPQKYGFDDVDYQAPLSYGIVRVPQNVSLSVVAKSVGVETDAIEELNPELVRDRTPPARSWTVRVPDGTAARFAANFPDELKAVRLAEAKEKAARKYYKVRRGDNLSVIAQRFDTSVSKLKRLNGLRGSLLRPGQKLRVS
ncbi:MAG: transglycosylase SLT domain-containing protein [Gemmatimonadota bacterium]